MVILYTVAEKKRLEKALSLAPRPTYQSVPHTRQNVGTLQDGFPMLGITQGDVVQDEERLTEESGSCEPRYRFLLATTYLLQTIARLRGV